MLVGSNAFFKDIDGFYSKDVDILELIDNPSDFKYCRQFRFKDKCVFQWKKMSCNDFIERTLINNTPMEIGKFLVPEFISLIDLKISDLRKLQPLIDNLDDLHKYEELIYNAYLENDDFYLTEDQLYDAYKMYLKYR